MNFLPLDICVGVSVVWVNSIWHLFKTDLLQSINYIGLCFVLRAVFFFLVAVVCLVCRRLMKFNSLVLIFCLLLYCYSLQMSIQWRIMVCFLFLWPEIVKYVFYGTIRNLKDQGGVCNEPGENSVYLQRSIHSLGLDFYLIVCKTVVFETY